ncbi:MAG: hypothetical protein KatS3mg079_630 [Caloramator sp.]|nr:MAG: hypothetical protein KatS3mg079_630 [Caloramator sp.]
MNLKRLFSLDLDTILFYHWQIRFLDAVKQGQIRHFFLIGGCDGARPGRNYYTEFAQKTPKDTIILNPCLW